LLNIVRQEVPIDEELKQELNLFVLFVIQSQNLLMVLFVKLIKPILII